MCEINCGSVIYHIQTQHRVVTITLLILADTENPLTTDIIELLHHWFPHCTVHIGHTNTRQVQTHTRPVVWLVVWFLVSLSYMTPCPKCAACPQYNFLTVGLIKVSVSGLSHTFALWFVFFMTFFILSVYCWASLRATNQKWLSCIQYVSISGQ